MNRPVLGESDRDHCVRQKKQIQTATRDMWRTGKSKSVIMHRYTNIGRHDGLLCDCFACYTKNQKTSKKKIKGVNKRNVSCEMVDD